MGRLFGWIEGEELMDQLKLRYLPIEVNGMVQTIPTESDVSLICSQFSEEDSVIKFQKHNEIAIEKIIDLFTSEKYRKFRAWINQICAAIEYLEAELLYDYAITIYFESVFGNISNPDLYYDGLGFILKDIKDPSKQGKRASEGLLGSFPRKTGNEAYDNSVIDLVIKYRSFGIACARINDFQIKVATFLSEKQEIPEGFISGLENTRSLLRNPPLFRGVKFSRQCKYCNDLFELTRTSGTKIRVHCEKEECKREHKKLQKIMERAKKQNPNMWVKESIGTCQFCKEKNVWLDVVNLCKVCVEEAPKG
jgi:serine/threonine protein kinase